MSSDTVALARSAGDIRDFVLDEDGQVPDWGEATARFRARLSAESPHSPRFSPEWARRTWARLLELDEAFQSWAESTALLTFTGQTTFPGGRPIPPCTHFELLTASRDARQASLSRTLNELDRWERIGVVGANESGYGHLHVGLYLSDQVSADRLRPVVDAHVNNCPVAGRKGHGSGAIEFKNDLTGQGETGLIGYLGVNLPGLDTRDERPAGVLSEGDHRVRCAAVLEAGGWNAVRTPRRSMAST